MPRPRFLLACLLATSALIGADAASRVAWAQDQSPAGLVYTQPLSPTAVREVQNRLKAAGAFQGAADGNWSNESAQALQAYQQSHALQASGEINPATAATLGIDPVHLIAAAPLPPPAAAPGPPISPPVAAAQPAAPPPPAPPSSSPTAAPGSPLFSLSTGSVRIIQSRLRQLGLYSGAVDGLWGSGSLAALQTFQRAHGLPPDGRVTAASVQALSIDPSTMQPQ